MTRWLLTGLVLIAAAPAEPTLAQRKRFAERHPMTLALDLNQGECVKVTAPAALGCAAPVWVCPASWSSAMCTGSFSEVAGVNFQLHAPREDEVSSMPIPALVLQEESGDDCPECECAHDMGIAFSDDVTPEEKARAVREFAKESARRHEECVREAAARQKAERVKLDCTVLMIDPCRQEAFIRCTGKNSDRPLGKTLRYSFGRKPGGEWES